MRDGFHVKSHNDEKKLAIDQQLLPQDEPVAVVASASVASSSTAKEPATSSSFANGGDGVHGPNATGIPFAVHLKLQKKKDDRYGERSSSNNSSSEHDSAVHASGPDIQHHEENERASPEKTRPTTGKSADSAFVPSSSSSMGVEAIAARIEPSSEWLIYRQRTNLTPRRREQRVEEMIQKVLTTPSRGEHRVLAVPPATVNGAIPPTRPRQPSLSASTYHQRVAASRAMQGKSPRSRGLAPVSEGVTPLTETEKLLLTSREATNRDVDRLLVTLFQNPATSNDAACTHGGTAGWIRQSPELTETLKSHTKLRFSTRRSELREQTAVALKSRNLVSRMDELRSLPQVLAQMAQKQRDKQQQLILSHGEDLILRNKRQSCINLLQRPPETPMFPSLVEQKQQQALKRKQVFDANEEAAARNAVNRWQTRRLKRQEDARRTYHQCQWLLLTTLAQTAVKWLDTFRDWKLRRDALRQVTMAKRIQAFWREQAKVRRNPLARLGHAAKSSLSSPFFRMPIVIKAILALQASMRRWLERKKHKHNIAAIAIIVTSWLEFQDVKFRRLILRFRKRVRDFQTMWRTWRTITDARIKLLLHVWAKLEKKTKRRHGILNANHSKPPSLLDGAGSALAHSLQPAAAISPEKHQKQLEGMHRHLKNGGTIQTPISATSASLGNASSSVATMNDRNAPKVSDKVKHDLEFRLQMEEDFKHAMQDFYATSSSAMHGRDSSTTPLYSLHRTVMATAVYSPPRSPQSRGKQLPSSSPWKALAGAVMTPPHHAEKVPLHLKMSMLRHLLSEKRKAFQVTKDRKRYEIRRHLCYSFFRLNLLCLFVHRLLAWVPSEEWKSSRQQMRRIDFRYNVLEELAAYQKFQAEHSVFLLLHNVSESEMLQLMRRAQEATDAATAASDNLDPNTADSHERSDDHRQGSIHSTDFPPHAPDSPAVPSESSAALHSFRRSTIIAATRFNSISLHGNSVVELLEDDERVTL